MINIFANFRSSDNDVFLNYIKNKYEDKSMTFFYDIFPKNEKELKLNSYNFLFLHEPNEFFGYHSYALNNNHLFTGIFTWNDLLLNNCNNAVLFTYNGRTIDEEYSNRFKEKSKEFNVSFVCGTKNLVEGHKLRHDVYSLKDKINIPKKWYYVLEDYDHKTNTRPGYAEYSKDLSHIPKNIDVIGYGKRILFDNSMFNVVIENVNYNNWYNKIGDNFLTKTIPIYWGCSNISDFGYDERGIIRFNNSEELITILNSLTPDLYNKMKPYVDYNYEIAKLDNIENKISEFFDEFFKINNV